MYPVYMYGIFNIQSNFIICHLVIYVIFVRIIFVFEKCIIMFSDHPSTIKKRFLSVLFMLIFSPLYTWYFIHDKIQVRFRQNINIFYIFKIKNLQVSILYWLGLKWDGLFISAASSFALTSILFLASICSIDFKKNHCKSIISK